MRMLRWILGLTFIRDKKRNDIIRRILGVACITDKVREARLRWFGQVKRREEKDCVRESLIGGRRTWTTEQGKTEKKVDRRHEVQHGGLAGRPDGRGEQSRVETENPCG